MEIETPMSYIYCNLDLKVRSETDHYTIEAQGPWGETVQSLCNLPSLAELHALIEQVQTKSDQVALEELDNSLFQLLFPTDVRLLYEAAKARLKEDVGLRLRLRLPNVLTPSRGNSSTRYLSTSLLILVSPSCAFWSYGKYHNL
jgi:hypothetical protein